MNLTDLRKRQEANLVNKETQALNARGVKIWSGIISSNIEPRFGGGKNEFEKAKKSTTADNELFDEIRSKKALLKELRDLEEMKAPEEVLKPLRDKLGLKTNGGAHTVQTNAEKIAFLELASQTEDPEIKAAILDMAFPEKSNDPIVRLERIIRMKKDSKPKSEENSTNAIVLEMMKYFREKADQPGQSPIETFTEMIGALEKYNQMTGKGTGDLNTVAGLVDAKKKLEELNIISSKSDIVENRKLDIEMKKVDYEFNFKENQAKREAEKEKEQMELAKEGAEIAGKALTKIFDKDGINKGSPARRTDKAPVFMHCTNPGCKYYTGKEQFEIAKPEDVGSSQDGREFSCPNDRGGCPNKYYWKGFTGEGGNPKVDQHHNNIDSENPSERK